MFSELKYVDDKYFVEIGNDVWLGDNVTILSGIKIGDGAIIGANSLIIKDIEPYSINVGSPSKIVRYRFEKEIIDDLLFVQWWNKDFKWLDENSHLFSDVNLLLKKLKG
jgi:serine acetyltransferase